ncbi:hypothetical protein AAK899_08375 [Erysipelotrichaceae bacterium 51-3]
MAKMYLPEQSGIFIWSGCIEMDNCGLVLSKKRTKPQSCKRKESFNFHLDILYNGKDGVGGCKSG